MHTLNDDDMEDLFRRAAEDYPLKTDGANWNKVMQELHPAKDHLPEENKKKKDYRYLLLMLLLPLGFVCGRYMGNDKKSALIKNKINKEVKINTASVNKKTEDGKTGETTVQKTNAAIGKGTRQAENAAGEIQNSNDLNEIQSGNNAPEKTNNLTIKYTNKQPHVPIERSTSRVAESFGQVKESNFDRPTAINLKGEYSQNEKDFKNSSKNNTGVIYEDKISPGLNHPVSGGKSATADTSKTNIKAVTKKDSKQKTLKGKLYYSLVIGPDISTIELQKTDRVGYSLGVMLGYRLSKKISVEAGALWDRKNYYTNGSYLDTNRLQLPVPLTVESAVGYCDMIEIPINFKYEFLTKKDHSWFVSAGASSYLMKNEYYTISYKFNDRSGTRGYGYKNSSKDWLSIINISAGYQKTFGRNTNISLAPYIKVPLKGVGIGKLPITSTGIYLTVSHKLH